MTNGSFYDINRIVDLLYEVIVEVLTANYWLASHLVRTKPGIANLDLNSQAFLDLFSQDSGGKDPLFPHLKWLNFYKCSKDAFKLGQELGFEHLEAVLASNKLCWYSNLADSIRKQMPGWDASYCYGNQFSLARNYVRTAESLCLISFAHGASGFLANAFGDLDEKDYPGLASEIIQRATFAPQFSTGEIVHKKGQYFDIPVETSFSSELHRENSGYLFRTHFDTSIYIENYMRLIMSCMKNL